MDWATILYVLGAALLLWFTYYSVRSMPDAFTKKKFFSTSSVLAVLTLALMAFIGILVVLLRQS